MDPLTAFSLACGVIQVIDFSMKTLAKCKEIYDHGSLREHEDIEAITKHLTNLRIDVDRSQGAGSSQTDDEKDLLDLGKECATTAERLITKLHELRIEGPHKKRQAMRNTLKAIRERRDIDDIQKRLNGYRSVLDSKILISLRQRLDLASLQRRQDFQSLDQGIQKLVTTLSNGPTDFEKLRALIRRENEETREHFSKNFQRQQEQLEEREYRKRYLESLWFHEIHSREENIVDAHKKTFQWIFEKSDDSLGRWDSFIDWLENGHGTYWINGRAGSGKSTLMSFLCQDDRTIRSLRTWSGLHGKDVLMIKFFFWIGGTRLERSIEGLLRSLIWQIVQRLPNLEVRSSIQSIQDSHGAIAAWTERRLQRTLRNILQQVQNIHHLCFFVDGLDEYEGDQHELIKFIQGVVQSDAVKVCLSSRSYQEFDRAFGSSAKLRLQDFTYNDIRNFVVDRFQSRPRIQMIAAKDPHWINHVTHQIVNKADGVFLWVSLAVKDQIRGLENNDSPEQLGERLRLLPDEVEGIYARMLSRIEKVYRREASMYLQMASRTECRSFFDFALASQDGLDDMLRSSYRLPERELIAKSYAARQRIVMTCAGLLEVNGKYLSEIDEESDFVASDLSLEAGDASSKPTNYHRDFHGEASDQNNFAPHRKVSVDFIHRTARDFLRDPTQGGSFLKENSPPDFHPQVSYAKVCLAKTRLFGVQYLSEVMSQTRIAEKETGVAQTGLCELIDDVMSRIDRSRGSYTDDHWTVRLECFPMHMDRLLGFSEEGSLSINDEVFSHIDPRSTPHGSDIELAKGADFIALAVYHQLYLYVQQVLYNLKKPLNSDTTTFLLLCSVSTPISGSSGDLALGLNLTRELLTRGGNPNLELGSSRVTTWSAFLLQMLERHRDVPEENDTVEVQRSYMQTTMAFIEKGADLQSICTVGSLRTCTAQYEYCFYVDLSALAIIELCLSCQPQLWRLRDLCAAKGARYYARCTRISVSPLILGAGVYDPKRHCLHHVSENDSTTILEIYQKAFASPSARKKWASQMIAYLKELFQGRFDNFHSS